MKENESEKMTYQGILPTCETQFSVYQHGFEGNYAHVTQEELPEEETLEDLKRKLGSQNEFFQTESLFSLISNPVVSTLLEIAELDPADPEQKRRMDELINDLREGQFSK